MTRRILVWDAPTRVFHWSLVLSFAAAYFTAESERYRDIHLAAGYVMLGLLAFRLLWGFAGTRYARFASFLFKPGETIAYLLSMLRGKPTHYLGHNPAGSLAVWLLLGLGIFLCVTGVLALQDDASDAIIETHGTATDIMLIVVALHVGGVIASSVLHRENLVRAMITGSKPSQTEMGIQQPYNWLAALMLVVALGFAFVFLNN